jgi:RNA polymerase sigma factor (sigma-70 family)
MVSKARPGDAELLAAFAEQRSEDAFAELVQRHGSMVLGVCRRVTRNTQDAEDAFQATFLVLARRATAVNPELLANWLYGVANRTALKARGATHRRRIKEQTMAMLPDVAEPAKTIGGELVENLDAALAKLPSKYRAALVMCDLEQKIAARVGRHIRNPRGNPFQPSSGGPKAAGGNVAKAWRHTANG